MPLPAHTVRFGPFQLDLRAAELHHNGTTTKLPEQPFQVLIALIEHPGDVVTREELRQCLWKSHTFVDFEHGLNTAVKRLREALGDSAENPRYIETLPRHGYRLMVPVEKLDSAAPAIADASVRRRKIWLAVSVLTIAAVAAGVLSRQRLIERFRPVKIESLAVLPLENLSGNPGEEYFADGMTEALITELGKVQALRVISRQSVMHYKGTNKTVPQIAKELNVDALVEGSTLRTGGKVRITTQLIRANPEHHLWSESYEGGNSDIIALQKKVSQAIVGEIRAKVTPPERARLAGAHPVNPQAYDAYLKGQLYLQRESGMRDRVNKAIHSFEEATHLDPNFALAYVGLAKGYIRLGDWGLLPPQEAFPKARTAALKAIDIDTTVAGSHIALGWVKTFYDWDWPGAEYEFRQATKLGPNDPDAHEDLGEYLITVGRYGEAEEEFKRDLELDPLSLARRPVLGKLYLVQHRYDEAIEQERVVLDMDPNNVRALIFLAEAHVQKGAFESAVKEMERVVAISEDKGALGLVGYVYAAAGRKQEARTILAQMDDLSENMYVSPFEHAIVYAGLGEKDEALRWLEKGLEERDHDMAFLKRWSMFDRLHSDARFQDLVRRMNFPQ
jgi:TolB-like protein/DNA-binding winged helix-turn-helix (wHTH) protein/tetratricopeptide (TPR) repeat protein